MTSPGALSIVVPVYNEEDNVAPLYSCIAAVCRSLGRPYEIVLVDDGSSDRTFETLARLQATDPTIRVIRFRRNYGQTAAMAAGFRAARGEVIVSMDGDLQNDPRDIPSLLAKLEEGFDVVCGWRKDRKDRWLSRRVPSMIANWLIGTITGVPIHDNGCSLKAYRAAVIKEVALYAEFHRFIPALSTLAGARIAEIVVRHHRRVHGKSKYGIGRAWRVFLDLFLIKMLTTFASRPGLWFAGLALPAAVLASVLAVAVWAGGSSGIVLPTVVLLCLALAGHLLALGVMGEMVLATGDTRVARTVARGTESPGVR